jgi:hypothetical protein
VTYPLDTIPNLENCRAITREMDTIANDARTILRALHGRQKFDLQTTSGWRDIMGQLYADRFKRSLAPADLKSLERLSTKWLSLHRHLTYVAFTRPVWNT